MIFELFSYTDPTPQSMFLFCAKFCTIAKSEYDLQLPQMDFLYIFLKIAKKLGEKD
jgi:hypothetical protein